MQNLIMGTYLRTITHDCKEKPYQCNTITKMLKTILKNLQHSQLNRYNSNAKCNIELQKKCNKYNHNHNTYHLECPCFLMCILFAVVNDADFSIYSCRINTQVETGRSRELVVRG